MDRTCENCKKNITYMTDRTECIQCAYGEIDAFEPVSEMTEEPNETEKWKMLNNLPHKCDDVLDTEDMYYHR